MKELRYQREIISQYWQTCFLKKNSDSLRTITEFVLKWNGFVVTICLPPSHECTSMYTHAIKSAIYDSPIVLKINLAIHSWF